MGRQNKAEFGKVYRLTLLEHQTHEVVHQWKFTKATAIAGAISALVLVLLLMYALLVLTPLRRTIPGYPDSNFRQQAIANAIKIDSLESTIIRWEIYTENLSRVLCGEESLSLDSIVRMGATKYFESRSDEELARSDEALRETVVKEEQFGVKSSGTQRVLPIEGMHFFSPLKGVVSQGYDMVIHPAVDITAPANTVVKAVMDGTVIYTGWSDEAGYTMHIQHANDVISVYKHNQKILKKQGDKVKAGVPIAHVGNTGSLTTGDHLHFELWYKGEAVDPTKYISF